MEITEEELNTKIADAVSKATADASKEKESLLNKNQELLNEKKSLSEKMKAFDGLDPENVKKMMETIQSSEDAKLISEGKVDEVVQKRVEKRELEFNEKLENITKERDELLEKSASLENRYNNKLIDDAIGKAAMNSKVQNSAIEDIQRRARDVFSVDEDGSIVARDKDGNIKQEGGKAVTPESFIKGLQQTAPHYWPASESADLSGSEGDDAALEAANKGNMQDYIKARKAQKG